MSLMAAQDLGHARIAPGEESARGRTGDRMRRPLEQRDLEMCVVYCDDV